MTASALVADVEAVRLIASSDCASTTRVDSPTRHGAVPVTDQPAVLDVLGARRQSRIQSRRSVKFGESRSDKTLRTWRSETRSDTDPRNLMGSRSHDAVDSKTDSYAARPEDCSLRSGGGVTTLWWAWLWWAWLWSAMVGRFPVCEGSVVSVRSAAHFVEDVLSQYPFDRARDAFMQCPFGACAAGVRSVLGLAWVVGFHGKARGHTVELYWGPVQLSVLRRHPVEQICRVYCLVRSTN